MGERERRACRRHAQGGNTQTIPREFIETSLHPQRSLALQHASTHDHPCTSIHPLDVRVRLAVTSKAATSQKQSRFCLPAGS